MRDIKLNVNEPWSTIQYVDINGGVFGLPLESGATSNLECLLAYKELVRLANIGAEVEHERKQEEERRKASTSRWLSCYKQYTEQMLQSRQRAIDKVCQPALEKVKPLLMSPVEMNAQWDWKTIQDARTRGQDAMMPHFSIPSPEHLEAVPQLSGDVAVDKDKVAESMSLITLQYDWITNDYDLEESDRKLKAAQDQKDRFEKEERAINEMLKDVSPLEPCKPLLMNEEKDWNRFGPPVLHGNIIDKILSSKEVKQFVLDPAPDTDEPQADGRRTATFTDGLPGSQIKFTAESPNIFEIEDPQAEEPVESWRDRPSLL